MQLLKDYFKLEQAIHDYFGYVEDWVTIPLDDHTDDYWMIAGPEDTNSAVVYSPDPLTIESVEAGNTIYSGRIYTQRFLHKWVYRAEDYTMVCVDTRVDGNKYLMIFDNSKETKEPSLAKAYNDRWNCF